MSWLLRTTGSVSGLRDSITRAVLRWVNTQRGTEWGYVVRPDDPWMFRAAKRATLTITVSGIAVLKLTSLRPVRTDGEPVRPDDIWTRNADASLARELERGRTRR